MVFAALTRPLGSTVHFWEYSACLLYTSGEFLDRMVADFNLTKEEQNMLKAVSEMCIRDRIKQVSAAYRAAGKKLVVVLNICSPVETASWKGLADACLLYTSFI